MKAVALSENRTIELQEHPVPDTARARCSCVRSTAESAEPTSTHRTSISSSRR